MASKKKIIAQPSLGSPIDSGYGFDTLFSGAGGFYDLLTGVPFTKNGTASGATIVDSAEGVVGRLDGTVDLRISRGLQSGAHQFFARFKIPSPGTYIGIVAATNGTAMCGAAAQLSGSLGVLANGTFCYFSGAPAGTFDVDTNEWITIYGGWDGVTAALSSKWFLFKRGNGAPTLYQCNASGAWSAGVSNTTAIGAIPHAALYRMTGDIVIAAIGNRAPSLEVGQYLMDNPFGMVTESRRKLSLYFGPNLITGDMAATETGQDVFAADGDVAVSGSVSAIETDQDTFSANGESPIIGDMAATETGQDVFAAEGGGTITGDFAATESGDDSFQASGTVIPIKPPSSSGGGGVVGQSRSLDSGNKKKRMLLNAQYQAAIRKQLELGQQKLEQQINDDEESIIMALIALSESGVI